MYRIRCFAFTRLVSVAARVIDSAELLDFKGVSAVIEGRASSTGERAIVSTGVDVGVSVDENLLGM